MIMTSFPGGGGNMNTQGINILPNNSKWWKQGGLLTQDGSEAGGTNRMHSELTPVTPGMDYALSSCTLEGADKQYEHLIYAYSEGGKFIKSDYAGGYTGLAVKFRAGDDLRYVRICVRHTDNSVITADEVGAKILFKLERGTTPTEWTPAPEDFIALEARVKALEAKVNGA